MTIMIKLYKNFDGLWFTITVISNSSRAEYLLHLPRLAVDTKGGLIPPR